MVESFVFGIVVAVVHPFIGLFVSKYTEKIRRERAFSRLENDPFFYVGATIKSLHVDGIEAPIMTDCIIYAVKPGEVTVQSEDVITTFTGREFEKLIPLWKRD